MQDKVNIKKSSVYKELAGHAKKKKGKPKILGACFSSKRNPIDSGLRLKQFT